MTWKALTRDEALVWNIPALIERGYTDEEIVDHIEHSPVLANQRFSMRDKRIVVEEIARVRRARPMVEPAAPEMVSKHGGLKRSAVLAAKRAHDAEGHNSRPTHKRLSVKQGHPPSRPP